MSAIRQTASASLPTLDAPSLEPKSPMNTALRRTRTLIAAAALASAGTVIAVSPASADEPDAEPTTWTALQAAFADGGYVTLGETITAPAGQRLVVDPDESVTLDLNGHDLTITAPGSRLAAIGVRATSALTVTDSSTDSAGTLTAVGGGLAAGIGGDAGTTNDRSPANSGTTTIEGGTVRATGGSAAAGIGGGYLGGGGTTTIEGGDVTATTTSSGAGIGSGAGLASFDVAFRPDSSDISITGGTVTARSGTWGAGIGGGYLGSATVTVSGGTVEATGGSNGAGIGSGSLGDGGTTTIDGGTITARGAAGAGIGSGRAGTIGTSTIVPRDGTVTINDGVVVATSLQGAGIGSGSSDADVSGTDAGDSITIDGGTVTARSDGDGAAIGGGMNRAGGAVTIGTDGDVTVSGPRTFGPGVGGTDWGSLSNAGTVRIAADSTLTVPDGVTVTNTGTITHGAVPDGSTTGAVDGTGTITNDGTITAAVANDGQGDPGTTVTHHSYVLSFADDGVVATDDLDDLGDRLVLARTVNDAGASLPAPALTGGRTFAGWYTTANGGDRITDTTDLSTVLDSGPQRVILHPHYAKPAPTTYPTTVTVTLQPSLAAYGQPVTATATVSAPGTVQFLVDDRPLGSPVVTTDGAATSPALTDPATGEPLEPGAHTVRAVLAPSSAVATGSNAQAALTVTRADTSTTVTASPEGVAATVTPVTPGAGTPSGTVTFSSDGTRLGTAELVDGVATLTQPTRGQVTASYAGDDHYAPSSATDDRVDPSITATATGKRGRHGWYTGPVTITFSCSPGSAPLVGACPGPVVLRRDGADQAATRTITATDGGTATSTVEGISIDQHGPQVTLRGVRNGTTYRHRPRVTCTADDALAGVTEKGCRLKRTLLTKTKHRLVLRYTATATDRAGNTTVAAATIRVRRR